LNGRRTPIFFFGLFGTGLLLHLHLTLAFAFAEPELNPLKPSIALATSEIGSKDL